MKRIYVAGREVPQGRIDKMLAKIVRGDGCWTWNGGHDKDGYAVASFNNFPRRITRILLQLDGAELRPGQLACHRCDNPRCVRPDHLFIGTNVDNMADMRSKGRAATGLRNAAHVHPQLRPRGEQHGNSKLTADQVRELRRRKAAGGVTYDQLAAEFQTSRSTIAAICVGRNRRYE